MDSIEKPSLGAVLRPLDDRNKNHVDNTVDSYLKYFEQKENNTDEGDKKAEQNSIEMTSQYYDMATDFYEYGWGESFHFSGQRRGESREHAFAKHEYKLAIKLGLTSNDTVLVSECSFTIYAFQCINHKRMLLYFLSSVVKHAYNKCISRHHIYCCLWIYKTGYNVVWFLFDLPYL